MAGAEQGMLLSRVSPGLVCAMGVRKPRSQAFQPSPRLSGSTAAVREPPGAGGNGLGSCLHRLPPLPPPPAEARAGGQDALAAW